MSHFTVLVIGENPEEQLRPYQENNMGDCPREYMKFDSVEDEYRKKYEEGTIKCVRDDEGNLVGSKYDDRFWKRPEGASILASKELILPDGYEVVEVPFKEYYNTFEEFIKDWAGYKEKDPETGEYGYWENPNAKWDWYQLGGRWKGFFKLKEGAKGVVGESGAFNNEGKVGWVDQVRRKDIDVDGMLEETAKEAAERYDEFLRAVRDVPSFNTPWDEFRTQYDNIDDAREAYQEIPFIKATRDICWGDPVVEYKVNEDNPRLAYIEASAKRAFATFAVIINGKWYEKGEMGWWGVTINEKDQEEWNKQLYALLKENSDDDTLFSVYDCHI